MASHKEPDADMVIYGGKNCLLCEEAKEAAEAVLSTHGLTWTHVDVRKDPALDALYGERIPVLVFRGEELAFGKISAADLARLVSVALK